MGKIDPCVKTGERLNGREIFTIGAVLKITGDKLTIDSIKRASAIAAYANKNGVSINKAIKKG